MIAHLAERKLAPFDDIWGKILDFRLRKFEVMSILKDSALLQKSPTPGKAWNQFFLPRIISGKNIEMRGSYQIK